MTDTDEGDGFEECCECGGSFDGSDLNSEGRCADCQEMLDDLFKDEDA